MTNLLDYKSGESTTSFMINKYQQVTSLGINQIKNCHMTFLKNIF